jgi:hypothetical protein
MQGVGKVRQFTYKEKDALKDPTHPFCGYIPVYVYDKFTGDAYGKNFYNVLSDGTRGTLHAQTRNVPTDEEDEEAPF